MQKSTSIEGQLLSQLSEKMRVFDPLLYQTLEDRKDVFFSDEDELRQLLVDANNTRDFQFFLLGILTMKRQICLMTGRS